MFITKKVAAAGLSVLFVSLLVRAEKKEKTPLSVVPSVDLTRYSGRWYEIARLPNRFEEKCASDVTAEYTLLRAGKIKVVNQCRKKDGRLSSAEGEAKLADKSGANSRLKVRFAPRFLSFLPIVWGDYQVMEVAPDYSHALVGEPGRKYLWILSRTPSMDEETFRRLTERAASEGFDVSKLVRTNHG